jgi:hypothetical protein
MITFGTHSLLRRYQDGQREQAWSDMIALGSAIRSERYWGDAQAVARETMKRALHNVLLLIDRLEKLGFKFYAPAAAGIQWQGPVGSRISTRDFLRHMPPDSETTGELDDIERCFGVLPSSLRAWYEIVGGVEFLGDHPSLAGFLGLRPEVQGHEIYPDPLVVFPPVYQFMSRGAEGSGLRKGTIKRLPEEGPELLEVSSSLVSKAGYGGGLPFQIRVPDPCADALLLRERHGTSFLDYIRLSFRWGGFPGWEQYAERPEKELAYLGDGLLEI